jgi:hypothetical protein
MPTHAEPPQFSFNSVPYQTKDRGVVFRGLSGKDRNKAKRQRRALAR